MAAALRQAQGDSASVEPRLGVLDGLRGVAVLLVLWYHVWEIAWLAPPAWLAFAPATGFIGVHLFFYLSGFVIAYPFVRAAARQRREPSWADFAWRRFIKIVPSYVLSIAIAYFLGYAQTQPNASTVPDLVTHLLFIHTWFPLRYGTIDGVLWTLAVEVEFYCVFPFIWACFRRHPWFTAYGMIAVAWLWRLWLAQSVNPELFVQWEENLPGYLDIFAFGMLSAHVFTNYGARWKRCRLAASSPALAAAGAVVLLALLENLYGMRLQPLWSSVWQINNRPMLGLCFAIIALGSLTAPRWWQCLLDNPPLRFLATISYNLYLYHQMVGRELLARHVPPFSGNPHRELRWQVQYTEAAFAFSIALAAIVTYGFERPLLALKAPNFRLRQL